VKTGLLFLLSIVGAATAIAAAPDLEAERIARGSARVRRLHARLVREARKIGDARLRKDTLALLGRPNFTVVEARRKSSGEIVGKLKAEGLWNTEFKGELFPDTKPMSFIAAPGGSWNGHHAYPGGLVYHTVTNLEIGLGIAAAYRDVHGVNVDEGLLRAAAIWHNSAKTLLLHWNEDGSETLIENRLANTFTHHLWAVAEAIHRGYPARFIVTLAAAHAAPTPGDDQKQLISFLKAGAIIAGRSFESAGLTADAGKLAALPPVEAFITNLDDHDYVLSMATMRVAESLLDAKHGPGPFWKRDAFLSEHGDLSTYAGRVSEAE
jgi:hypothetical protein